MIKNVVEYKDFYVIVENNKDYIIKKSEVKIDIRQSGDNKHIYV